MSSNTIEIKAENGTLLALIIEGGYRHNGVVFHTNVTQSQQVGTIQHLPGHKVLPHYHPPRERRVNDTQEVIFVRRGTARVDFYDQGLAYVTSYILRPLDTLVHLKGGHAFEVLTDFDAVEVKQGPYDATTDKIQFAEATDGTV